MNTEEIFEVIVGHTREVIPGLDERRLQFDDTLRSLGANSVDRSEIVMMTLRSLSLNIPLIETVKAQNIGELASILHGKLQLA
jgi:polyketide biosynthesis acyl carrier protein